MCRSIWGWWTELVTVLIKKHETKYVCVFVQDTFWKMFKVPISVQDLDWSSCLSADVENWNLPWKLFYLAYSSPHSCQNMHPLVLKIERSVLRTSAPALQCSCASVLSGKGLSETSHNKRRKIPCLMWVQLWLDSSHFLIYSSNSIYLCALLTLLHTHSRSCTPAHTHALLTKQKGCMHLTVWRNCRWVWEKKKKIII